MQTVIQESQSFPQKFIKKPYSLAFCPKAVPFRDGNTLDPHETAFGQKQLKRLKNDSVSEILNIYRNGWRRGRLKKTI